MESPQILIVDDDARLLRLLALRLESEGYTVATAGSGAAALAALERGRPQFVLTDMRMPELDGMELLTRIQDQYPGVPVAIMTGHGDIPDAVRATQAGAVDFLTKPVDDERLLELLRRHLGAELAPRGDWAADIITRCPQMRAVLTDAGRVARMESAVLITGASGTGKELMAQAIHRASRRAARPFVAAHCAGVSPEQFESELFGHRRGAFSGAHTDYAGLFRAAEGGSVFLDEIAELPLPLQAKLARVLQEREVRPLGDTRAVAVDVRVITATHRDLEACVAEGRFREDLYYRLNVVRLRLPPLSQRREDIPLLVAHHLVQLAQAGAPRRSYSPEAMEVLVAAAWPGNVRELFNMVEQNVAVAPSRVIGAALVRASLGENSNSLPPFDQARAEFTRNYLRHLLEISEGNISRAARLAGRNRTDFYKLLSRHHLDPREFKHAATVESDY
jgi:two-component system response regulator GlrR